MRWIVPAALLVAASAVVACARSTPPGPSLEDLRYDLSRAADACRDARRTGARTSVEVAACMDVATKVGAYVAECRKTLDEARCSEQAEQIRRRPY